MKPFLQNLVVRVNLLLGPINRLPTWSNEGLGGIVLMLLLLLPALRWPWWQPFAFPVALLVSHGYEVTIDPWEWNAEDVLWRAYGAGLVWVVWGFLR